MGEHTYEQKEKVHLISMEVLKEFIRICEKHNLTYFAVFGTAIGAVRHNGFIPWDDDIDVAMPRKDYDRFVEIAKSETNDGFDYCGAAFPKKALGFFVKMFKKGTVYSTKNNHRWKFHNGVWIDVFPYDCVPDDPSERKKLYKKTRFLDRLYIIQNTKYPYLPGNSLKTILTRVICWTAYYVMKITGPSMEKVIKKHIDLQTQYEGKTKNRTLYSDATPDMWVINDDEIYPLQDVPFEDITIKIPAKNHEILTRMYGDYMTPPPVEERTGHFMAEIDLGEQ